jgi:hypothetical protein
MPAYRNLRLTLSLAVLWLVSAASLRAQDAPDVESTPSSTVLAAPAAGPSAWIEADYLLWWVRKGPLPTPLVTAGSVNDPMPGGIGQPNTTVINGGNGIDFGALSGMRLNFGVAIDPDAVFNIEGGYLTLIDGTTSFAAGGNGAGTNVIARPLVSAFTGGEFVEATSFPGSAALPFSYAGATSVVDSTRFSGYEMNLSANVLRNDTSRLTLIAGFRTLDLDENITIRDELLPITAGILTFLGTPFDAPSTLRDFDSFRTVNRFYGGQVGGRYDLQMGNLGLETVGKIALGVTQQMTTIDGATALVTPGAAPQVAPGGILAQPTNMGDHFHETFSAVPEVDFNLTYKVTSRLEVRAGYSVLFWTNVLRPGNTIDRTVNWNQVPSDQGFGTMPGGAARPGYVASQTSFWAQGVNFGLTYSF